MKKIILTALLFCLTLATHAQERSNRWVLGGSLGFSLGESRTSLNISPQLGYRLTDSFTLGGGFNYAYYKWKSSDSRSNYLGLNAYAQLTPIRYLRLFVQPEVYRRWGRTAGISDEEKVFATLLVGGGVIVPVVRGGISMSVYYDVIQNENSPYRDRLIYSVGYTFFF